MKGLKSLGASIAAGVALSVSAENPTAPVLTGTSQKATATLGAGSPSGATVLRTPLPQAYPVPDVVQTKNFAGNTVLTYTISLADKVTSLQPGEQKTFNIEASPEGIPDYSTCNRDSLIKAVIYQKAQLAQAIQVPTLSSLSLGVLALLVTAVAFRRKKVEMSVILAAITAAGLSLPSDTIAADTNPNMIYGSADAGLKSMEVVLDGMNIVVTVEANGNCNINVPAPVDHAERITLPAVNITHNSIDFIGAAVTDSDNPAGFVSTISYIVKDVATGNTVSRTALSANTQYTWEMQYTTYNGATNTLVVKKTPPKAFTTLSTPNTAPSAVSLSNIQTLTAGSLTSGQTVATLNCVDAETPNTCTYTTTDSRFTITGNTLKISATGTSLAAGDYTIPVIALDPSGAQFSGSVIITIVAAPDTVAPVITLTGQSVTTLNVGDTYTEQGATCNDNKDGVRSVSISGTVNTSAPGTYTVTYTCSDLAGNSATTTRTVNVLATLTKVSESLPNFDNASGSTGAGSLTLNRIVPSGTTITSSFVDVGTGTTLVGGSVSAIANGTPNLTINWTTPSWPGKTVKIKFIIQGVTIYSDSYQML